MAVDIGPKIGIDGEAEFRQAINNINQQLKTLGSEMAAVTSAFNTNDSSQDRLAATTEVLKKQVGAQAEKLALLRQGLAESTQKYGESDAKTQKWQQAVYDATAKLNELQSELRKENDLLDNTDQKLDETKNSLDETGEAAKDSGSKFDAFGSVLKGTIATLGAVTAAAGAVAIKLGKEVVESFGELEQNLGGSEAVFQEYADHMQKIGEDAYKNMGVSQSQYLATANKMGALFQGSGLDVQKSAELTEKAMQRAADMASVMGIDMQMALDSVAGAAKGNFTMMDNLGVAMNATTITAYALEKGLVDVADTGVDMKKLADAQDKVKTATLNLQSAEEKRNAAVAKYGADSTQAIQASINLEKAQVALATANRKLEEAMEPAQEKMGNWWNEASNAEKAEVAMQMFFEKTEQYAGNFARESTQTVTGSLGLLKASVESFTAGLGNSNADITKLVGNVADAFTAVVDNVVPVLDNIVAVMPEAMNGIMTAIKDALPALLDTVTSLFRSVLEMLLSLLPELIPVAIDAIMTIVDTLINNLPLLINGAMQIILALANGITYALPELIPAVIDTVITIVDNLIDNIDLLVDASIAMMIALSDGLIDALPRLIEKAPEIIEKLMDALIRNVPKLLKAAAEVIGSLVIGIVDNLPKLGEATGKIIEKVLSGLGTLVKQIVDVGKNIVQGLWDGIVGMGDWIKEKISGFFGGIVDGIKGLLGIHSPSKVFADEVGAYMAEGIGVGFSNEMKAVSAQMQKAIPTPDVAFRNVAAGMVNGMQTAMTGVGGNYRIEIPVIINGREMARAILSDLRAAMKANPEVVTV